MSAVAESSLESVLASTDLIEAPADALPTYEPGTLESSDDAEQSRRDLSIDEAARSLDDDAPARDAKIVATIEGKQLTKQDLIDAYNVALAYQQIACDIQDRYALVAQIGKNVIVGAASLSEYVSSLLPPAPPVSLSHSNPQLYVQQKAAHEQAQQVVSDVVERAQEVIRHVMNQAALVEGIRVQDQLAFEAERFRDTYPQSKESPEWREDFWRRVRKAASAADYTEEELRQVTDHRAFIVLHWASIGMDKHQASEQARQRPKRPKPRLVASNEPLTLSDVMRMDFD